MSKFSEYCVNLNVVTECLKQTAFSCIWPIFLKFWKLTAFWDIFLQKVVIFWRARRHFNYRNFRPLALLSRDTPHELIFGYNESVTATVPNATLQRVPLVHFHLTTGLLLIHIATTSFKHLTQDYGMESEFKVHHLTTSLLHALKSDLPPEQFVDSFISNKSNYVVSQVNITFSKIPLPNPFESF